MSKSQNPTQDEHYVPRVYLKGFSPDGKNIHFYDFRNDFATIKPVPVKSIFFEKNLYEARNSDKEIIYTNHVEKVLHRLETKYSTYLKRIQHKIIIPDNYRTNYLLDGDELAFWIAYTTIQLLRTPRVLSTAKDFIKEHLSETIGEAKAENIALSYCMPFFSELNEDSVTAFNTFVKPFLSMNVEIGIIEGDEVLLTADYPVYVESPNWGVEEYRKVIFPLTSKICLFFYGMEEKALHKHNKLVPITPEMYVDIVKSMAYRCEAFLVSENRFTKKQIKMLKNAKFMMNDYSAEIPDEK